MGDTTDEYLWPSLCIGVAGGNKLQQKYHVSWRHPTRDSNAAKMSRVMAPPNPRLERGKNTTYHCAALTTVPHITAAQAAGTGCSFGRCQGSCDTCCTIGPPKSSPAAHAAWVCTKPRARVERHTRGPAYPDIDIGASQTDSALMRGTAAGEGPARPRRCGCPRVKRIATRDVFV